MLHIATTIMHKIVHYKFKKAIVGPSVTNKTFKKSVFDGFLRRLAKNV